LKRSTKGGKRRKQSVVQPIIEIEGSFSVAGRFEFALLIKIMPFSGIKTWDETTAMLKKEYAID
jgi:hypothetical protein